MSGKLFWMECRRIFFKKTNLFVLFVSLLAVLVMGASRTLWGESVIDHGQIYYRKDAIALNREIAAEFSGTLTESTVRAIADQYEASEFYMKYHLRWANLEDAASSGSSDNYCNRFIYWMFGETVTDENGETAYVLPENLSDNPYLQGDYVFGYAGNGWTGFWDHFMVPYMLVAILIIIALAPMFSEDYSLHISDIVLPTYKGRLALWGTRITAACFSSTIYYWLVCGTTFLQMLYLYGPDGLKVSCLLADMPIYWLDNAAPLWKVIIQLYLCGWFAILVLTIVVCAVSAKCRQPFLSLIYAALSFIAPFAIDRFLLDALNQNKIVMSLHWICYSSAPYYPFMFLGAPDGKRLLITGIAAAAALAGAVGGAIHYCRHQT